jgi:hypothetical protein
MPSSSIYSSVVFVHALAATILMGSSLSFVFTRRAIRSAATVQELRGWLGFARTSAAANPVAALALLATGVYLGSQGWWTEPWFFVALAIFFFDVLYAVRRAHAVGAELGQAAGDAPAGAVPEALDRLRWSTGLDTPHDALLASDLAVLFIMFVKPGLVGCVAAIGVAAVVVSIARVRRRARGELRSPDRDGAALAPEHGVAAQLRR